MALRSTIDCRLSGLNSSVEVGSLTSKRVHCGEIDSEVVEQSWSVAMALRSKSDSLLNDLNSSVEVRFLTCKKEL